MDGSAPIAYITTSCGRGQYLEETDVDTQRSMTMSDKEWLEQIKSVSDKELMEHLEWCGHDNYYSDLYEPIIKEIKRRLRSRR